MYVNHRVTERFGYHPSPEGLCVVHDQVYNHKTRGSAGSSKWREEAYLRIEIVDLINGAIDITGMDGLSDIHPAPDRFFLDRKPQIGFLCEPFGRSRISFADQIVHNNEIDVPVNCVSQ